MRAFQFIVIFILLAICSCQLTNDKIKKETWKYEDGYRIKDFLYFDSDSLSNDTIFIHKIPTAVIINKKYGWVGYVDRITIKSLQSGETGIYLGR
jgi:hypothetical protein